MTENDDPIFALIERHKTMVAAFDAAIQEQSDAEETLPKSQRQSTINRYGVTFVRSDAPRWKAALHSVDATGDAMHLTGLALLDCEPKSPAGALALLSYMVEHIDRYGEAMGFPDRLLQDGVEPGCRSPEFFAMQNAVSALSRAA
jgi:hypothetical protein